MTTSKVHGPPGTGKTTKLLAMMKERGDSPDRLGFVAFTRAAIHEAQTRLGVKSYKEAPFIRTMHSLCYHGLDRPDFLTDADMKVFGGNRYAFASHKGNPSEAEADELLGMADPHKAGEVYRRFNQWARSRMLPYAQAYDQFPHPGDQLAFEWTRDQVLGFCAEYDAFRRDTRKVDYTDLLEEALQRQMTLPVQTLYVDEAQDLSPLQWALVRLWASAVRDTILAGDADQAIYDFQGAESQLFLDYPADAEITLGVSHRLPMQLLERSQQLIRRNKRRKAFRVEARGEGGTICYFNTINELRREQLSGDGTIFILARNIYLLIEVSQHLMSLAVPFNALRGPHAWAEKEARTMLALWHLQRSEPISGAMLQSLSEQTESKPYWEWGAKTRLKKLDAAAYILPDQLPAFGATAHLLRLVERNDIASLKMAKERAVYLRRIIETLGEQALLVRPRLSIGTMHSVKGQEADTVIALSGMSRRTHESYWNDPEPERRVFYVAMTRARQNLLLQTAFDRRSFSEW